MSSLFQTEHGDSDSKAAIAQVLLSSPISSSTSHVNTSIKEEADSSTSVFANLIQVQTKFKIDKHVFFQYTTNNN